LVYIIYTRRELLEITGQILVLLGLSGGTSVASKVTGMARVGNIPQKYLDLVKRNRLPHFRDLISIGDSPNIFKFQIFAFTLISGFYVIFEILRTGNFPVFSDNLLILMGISDSVYVANELATENIWTQVRDLVKKIEANAMSEEYFKNKNKKEELEQELDKLRLEKDEMDQKKIPTSDSNRLRVQSEIHQKEIDLDFVKRTIKKLDDEILEIVELKKILQNILTEKS